MKSVVVFVWRAKTSSAPTVNRSFMSNSANGYPY